MEVALLNVRITFQKNSVIVDKIGNHQNEWADVYSCYATVSGESPNENTDAGVNKQFRMGIQRYLCFLQHCTPFSCSAWQTKTKERKAGNGEDSRSYTCRKIHQKLRQYIGD